MYAVWLTLFFQRIRHLKNNPPKAADFATGSAALHYFEPVEMPANNLRNLFEMPVLFLALVPLLLITQMASDIQVGMAWIFVALRIVHSIIHRSEEHTSALQSLMPLSYSVFCLKNKSSNVILNTPHHHLIK